MTHTHYVHEFTSRNDENQKFTLEFDVDAATKIHIVTGIKVYQHRGDMFCKVIVHISNNRHSLHVTSLFTSHKFGIDIYIRPDGCEIFVIETVLTTISHANIKPQS